MVSELLVFFVIPVQMEWRSDENMMAGDILLPHHIICPIRLHFFVWKISLSFFKSKGMTSCFLRPAQLHFVPFSLWQRVDTRTTAVPTYLQKCLKLFSFMFLVVAVFSSIVTWNQNWDFVKILDYLTLIQHFQHYFTINQLFSQSDFKIL